MEKVDEMKKALKDVIYFDSFRSDVFDQDLVRFNRNEKEKLYYDMMTKHNWAEGELESYEESLSKNQLLIHNEILSNGREDETQIRVVSATVHNDTNEVEIIIEKTVEDGLGTTGTLHSLWIDCEDEIANSEA